jgi:hypothetical protein
VPEEVVNPTHISIGFQHTCAVSDAGVTCWGSNANGRSTVPTLSNPTDVSAGHFHSCAIDDSGVVCWGNNANGRATAPAGFVNPVQISSGGPLNCVLDDNGVSCWGASGAVLTVPTLINPRQVSVDKDHACAMDDTGVVCWGNGNSRAKVRKRTIPTLDMVLDSDSDGVIDADDSARFDSSMQ